MSLAESARRHTTTIVLSVLAASACLYVFVVDRGTVTTQESEQRKRNIFPAWRVDDIDRVTIERAGKTATLTRRDADGRGQRFWDVSFGAEKFGAEEQQVDQFLGTLEFSTYERVVEAGSMDVRALGFDHPRLRVTIVMSGRTMVLTLGASASAPVGAVFAQLGDGSTTRDFVLNKELAAALDLDPTQLRERRLIPFASTDIARMEFVTPNETFHLERSDTNSPEMRLAGPTKDAKKRVQRRTVDELLAVLGRADAASFLADDVADKALKDPVTITFVPKDSTQTRGVLAIGGACPDNPEQVVAIQREPSRISACITNEIADALPKSADALVDRSLFWGNLDEVEEIAFAQGDKRLELARKGTSFHQRTPVDRNIEASAGQSVLEGLFALRATNVLIDADRAALGLDKPLGNIRLTSLLPAGGEDGGDDERVEEILVGTVRGDELAVSRGKEGAVLMLPATAMRDLFPSEVALRSLTVIDQPETVVRSLRIEQGDRVQRIERTSEGGWKLIEPTGRGLAADIGLGTDIATTLFPLKAERFIASKDDGTFGFDKPRIIVDAHIGSAEAGDRKLRLLLGSPTTNGSFARLEGDDAVFIVPRAVETVLSQWLIDRAVFAFDLAEVVKVTVNQKDKTKKPLVLERTGEALTIVGAPKETSAAATLRDALADLTPYAAVSVGAPRKEQGLDPPAFTVVIERARRGADAHDSRVDPERTIRLVFGAKDVFRGQEVVYVRRDGIDATYVMAKSKAHTFVDLLY